MIPRQALLTDEMIEACPSCAELRTISPSRARCCRSCKGTGFRRKVTTYLCNGCGGSMVPAPEHTRDAYGLIDAQVTGGYFSEALSDGAAYLFSLCETCLRKAFDWFAVPPKVFVDAHGTQEDYAVERAAVQRGRWRARHAPARFGTGRCNYEEACEGEAAWVRFVSDEMTEDAFCVDHATVCVGNERFLPAAAFDGQLVPYKAREAWGMTEYEAHAAAWLEVGPPRDRPVWWRFTPGPIRDVVLSRFKEVLPASRRVPPSLAPVLLITPEVRASLRDGDGAFSALWVRDELVPRVQGLPGLPELWWEPLLAYAFYQDAAAVELPSGVVFLFPHDVTTRGVFSPAPPLGSLMAERHLRIDAMIGTEAVRYL